jgi:predicted transcriptional regulator
MTEPTYIASSEELAAIDEALAQAERGEFASEAEVEAAFQRFRAIDAS